MMSTKSQIVKNRRASFIEACSKMSKHSMRQDKKIKKIKLDMELIKGSSIQVPPTLPIVPVTKLTAVKPFVPPLPAVAIPHVPPLHTIAIPPAPPLPIVTIPHVPPLPSALLRKSPLSLAAWNKFIPEFKTKFVNKKTEHQPHIAKTLPNATANIFSLNQSLKLELLFRKIVFDRFVDAVENCDISNSEITGTIVTMYQLLPSKLQLHCLQKKTHLNKVEKDVMKITSIKWYEEKMKMIVFRASFNEKYNSIYYNTRNYKNICIEIRQNQNLSEFVSFLSTFLKEYQTYDVNLSRDFYKLFNIKSQDTKESMLSYLTSIYISENKENNNSILTLAQKVSDLQNASLNDFKYYKEEASNINKEINGKFFHLIVSFWQYSYTYGFSFHSRCRAVLAEDQ